MTITRTESTPRLTLGAKIWALLWSIASVVVLQPGGLGVWAEHVLLPDGSSETLWTQPSHPTLWFAVRLVVLLSTFAAPLVALRWPLRAIPLAISSVITATIPVSFITVTLGAFLALLGVACSALFTHRILAWVIGLLSLGVPAAFILSSSIRMWSWGTTAGVSSQGWDGSQRLVSLVLYALGVVLALGTTTSIWLSGRRAADQHAVAVRRAEVNERAALARDLHDVVAHRMSLVAVRAETAPYSLDNLTPEARAAFGDIAREARGALDEMRSVLGVLDRGDNESPALAPQPSADDIPALITAARQAGSSVEVVGEMPRLDPLTGTTAYRVVQEALTNARRHAPNRTATVMFDQSDEALTIRITNPSEPGTVEIGRGLAGMKERVERSGGMFHVKHEESVGDTTLFVVEASLPSPGLGSVE